MAQKFHQELQLLKAEVLDMGSLSTCFLERGMEAMVNQDVNLANSILDMKDQILEKDRNIEAKTLQLLTLHQPMAKDLRLIAAILKIITYITRIGRYGKDIASLVEELSAQPHVKKIVHLPRMMKDVVAMIRDALDAFETEKIDKIQDMAERDDVVDEMRYEIFRECLTYMMENAKNITRCTHYIMMARYLERCGDHACKIAEKVHYMVTGEHVEIK